ncbi:MAG: energy transducer TonB [Gammaproteobacteria bacterium]|nr:energy transducer TonB [Gammaproteobacteria bacterium]MDH3506177.1 energy transducer TonB [Gammaproteobacteria bacterium]
MATESTVLRFTGSFGIALCVVMAMLWFSLEISGFNERQQRREIEVHEVSVLTEDRRRDFRELLGEGQIGPSPMLAPLAEIAPLDLSRGVRGIVQLEVLVDPSGAVTDVRVIDASPAGVYEAQAIAEIGTRRYEPEYIDGRAMPTRRLEIVDFTVRSASED